MTDHDQQRDCQHGQLARSCERCADAAEIEELQALLFARAVTIRALEDERDSLATASATNFRHAREWAERAGALEAEFSAYREGSETAFGHVVDAKKAIEASVNRFQETIFSQQRVIAEMRTERDKLRVELDSMRRGECICKSCGLRQPGEAAGPVPF